MRSRFILALRRIYSTEVIFVKRHVWPWLLLLLGAGALLRYPEAASGGVAQGLRLCGSRVIPALFPFFVLSRLAVGLGLPQGGFRTERWMRRLFGVGGGCLSPLLVSFVGGYPVGVATLTGSYEQGAVTKEEAERALCFCNNSGPAFFAGIVGPLVLGSLRDGLALYGIHCLCAILTGILLASPATGFLRIRRTPRQSHPSLLDAIGGACASLLQISGLILFFSVLLSLLQAVGVSRLLPPLAQGLLLGSLELTTGIMQLQGPAALVPCAFLMGWGGLCVHLQGMSLWRAAGLRPKGYFSAKLLHGLLSALFAAAYRNPTAPLALAGPILVLACAAVLPGIRKKRGSIPRKLAL